MRSAILIILSALACGCAARDDTPAWTHISHPLNIWLAGVTVADEPRPYDSEDAMSVYQHLHTLGVRAVALTPVAFMRDVRKPLLRWRSWGRVREGIDSLHHLGFAVLIKPYIWSSMFVSTPGTWTGDIEMQSDSDWHSFFAQYQEFILLYARIAEETHAELFSIGLEYPKTFSRGADWDSLICAVRNVYHGPITYASTGVDEAENVPFWNTLDVIGVDAFVPLTKNIHPTKKELCESWNAYIVRLDSLHHLYNKPIVFTEAGYKSCVGAACKPWEWNELTPHPIDLAQQALCYDALSECLFNKPWFSGIFWWKYYTSMDAGGKDDNDFIPLGKPAEAVMQKWFAEVNATKKK